MTRKIMRSRILAISSGQRDQTTSAVVDIYVSGVQFPGGAQFYTGFDLFMESSCCKQIKLHSHAFSSWQKDKRKIHKTRRKSKLSMATSTGSMVHCRRAAADSRRTV